MISIQHIFRSFQRTTLRSLPETTITTTKTTNTKGFHSLNSSLIKASTLPGQNTNSSILLQAINPILNLTCGLKVVGKLERRCKDCYKCCFKGRWYMRCKTHPRHKQAQMVKKEKNTWILTSVCQHPKRPWY